VATGTIGGGVAGGLPTTAAQTEGPPAEVISLTNARRAEGGCGPVAAQGELARAAQGHADDMAANDYFDHQSQDGRSPGDRAAAQGYTGNGWGENIAQGQQTPADVVEGWMNSEGHRANIMNCDWTSIGVGYNAEARTWVQVFGAGDDDESAPPAPAPEAPAPAPEAPGDDEGDDGMPGDDDGDDEGAPEAAPATPVDREPTYTG
jgi:hypothetical protein